VVFRGDLRDGAAPWVFAAAMVVWLVAFALVARTQQAGGTASS
jgi:hypothetical protein